MSIDFYAGTPTYNRVDEPQIQIDDVAFDSSGFPWIRHERGWIAGGDTRVQDWETVMRWFG